MAEGDRHPGGRPTKYRPEFCTAVGLYLDQGYSLTSFAAECDVARSTINEWIAQFPEFSEAVHKAQAKKARWWETTLLGIARNGGGPGAATAAIFGIKNAAPEDFRDKQDVEHSGPGGVPLAPPVINVSFIKPDDRDGG